MISYLITDSTITLFGDAGPRTIDATHRNYYSALDAIRANDLDAAYAEADIAYGVNQIIAGFPDFALNNGVVSYQGTPLRGYAVDRLLALAEQGLPIEPLGKFLCRVQNNPSSRAVNELYQFLERGQLPLTPDGKFIAYKKIRADWKDCHSGTIDNSPGTVVSMPRNRVNDDPTQTCSHGLHVCSMEYLASFGGDRTVAVEVDPADVVSVPIGYSNTKMRVCRYVVLREIEQPTTHNPWDRAVVDVCEYDEDEYDEDPDGEYDEDLDDEVEENLKPFDLKAALAGAPVQTRDGSIVTNLRLEGGTFPLIGEVEDYGPQTWTITGSVWEGTTSKQDLFMA